MKKVLMLLAFTIFNAQAVVGSSNPSELAHKLKSSKSSEENRAEKKYNISFSAGKELGENALSTELNYFLKSNNPIIQYI